MILRSKTSIFSNFRNSKTFKKTPNELLKNCLKLVPTLVPYVTQVIFSQKTNRMNIASNTKKLCIYVYKNSLTTF